ncbi:MAG: TonB-dependent receptor [Pseudomonadota bacterium]
MSLNRFLLAATCSIGALSFATPVNAQVDDETAEETTLDTVTVTATRRATDIQEVPIAVTTVSSEQLDRKGVLDARQLERASSSFKSSTASQADSTVFRIRGVGTTGSNAGFESAVGVFIDGVYLSRPAQAVNNLFDIEQIEVLRGPQGTLFGRNTSAGAINIRTKQPNTSAFEAFGNASYGNYNFVSLQGAINVPIVEDSLGLRLSVSSQDRDAFVDSTNAGVESHDRNQSSIRGQLLWEGHEDLSIRLIVDYSDIDEQCCGGFVIQETPLATPGIVAGFPGTAFEFVGLPANGGVSAVGESAVEDKIYNGGNFSTDGDQIGYSAELKWDLGFGELTYLPAYREYSANSFNDADFVALDVFSVDQSYDIESTTHELRLQGTAFDDRLDWLVGGFYSDETIERTAFFTGGSDYLQYIGASLVANPMIGTSLGPNPLLIFSNGVDAGGNFGSNDYTQESESLSVFTHNIISLTDKLELTVGARYVEESKTGSFLRSSESPLNESACFNTITNPLFANPPFDAQLPIAVGLVCFPYFSPADLPGSGAAGLLPTPATYSQDFDDDELVYTVKLGYELNENVNTYAAFTHGFKSGGLNLDATAAVLGNDPSFDSEKVDSFELGVKSKLFNGRARANIALFHMDIEDFQLLEFTGINFSTFNVPKAESTGIEFELDAGLTDDLSISTAITYADAKYPDDCADGLAADSSAGIVAQVNNLCGASLTNAPELTGVLGATYERQLSNDGWSLFATGGLRYESDRRTSTQPSDPSSGAPAAFDVQPSNTKYDARIGFVSPDQSLTFELWGLNLSDERTRSISLGVPFRGLGPLGARLTFIEEPRTYGATIRKSF